MKPVDLTKLNYERLQRYRKSLTAKCNRYSICWCGVSGCEFNNDELKHNHLYLEFKTELNRVLTECNNRNKVLAQEKRKQTWAHVATHKDLNPKYRYKRK